MPKIQWTGLPAALRDHLFDRLRERNITAEDLYQLKAWRESDPDAPDGLVGLQFLSKPVTIDGRRVRQYLTRMKTTVSTKGQIILPAEFRQRDGIEPGQEFEVERIDRGEYRLKRKERRRNEGLVKLLLACPVKGWFNPMDRRGTTAGIKVPKLG
jgi:AbrB family looped-hinge helix DNA binding protein